MTAAGATRPEPEVRADVHATLNDRCTEGGCHLDNDACAIFSVVFRAAEVRPAGGMEWPFLAMSMCTDCVADIRDHPRLSVDLERIETTRRGAPR